MKKKRDAKIRTIKSGRIDNLSISLDYDYNPEKRFPVILFTPDMKKAERDHYHIRFTKREATKLRDYLNAWLIERKENG